MTLFFAMMPLLALILMMTYKKGLPSYLALPLAALFTYVLQLAYFRHDFVEVHATVLAGALTTWTPILILWGAVFLFKTMEVGGSLDFIRKGLNQVSRHPVAQLMIVGWAFSFFIEGISGFGTPAALAAPLLVGFGFPALPTVLFCLALNTIPVTFGAVGTPIWFGFGELGLAPNMVREVGIRAAIIQSVCALVIPVLALRFMVSWKVIFKNTLFIYACILATVLPYFLFSFFDSEFPSILGGLCGLVFSISFAKMKFGLSTEDETASEPMLAFKMSGLQYFKALFPLVACVLILLVTRIQFFCLKGWLNQGENLMSFMIPSVGQFQLSTSLVMKLNHIFSTSVAWKHALLYIPSILPFGFVCAICFVAFRFQRKQMAQAWNETISRLVKPFFALLGAMIFVKLYMLGGENSPVIILGSHLAEVSGAFWRWSAVYLGALGSFFAGSATVSNLTFGGIQIAVAEKLNVPLSTVLALQATGGAMGNMACIHNIVAVCAVLGLEKTEGVVLKRIFPLLLIYGALAGCVALLL